MILWLLRQLLCLRKFSETALTPHHVALACALGMVLGLLPKGNLLAVVVTMVVLSLRINLGVVMVATLCFTLCGRMFDPITHPIGVALLTHEGLAGFWSRIFALPLMPWTALHNTVVLGTLLFELAVVVPFYFVVRRVCGLVYKRFPARSQDDQAADTPSAAAAEPIQQAA